MKAEISTFIFGCKVFLFLIIIFGVIRTKYVSRNMNFEDYKKLVLSESATLKLKEPAVLLKKSYILQKEGESTLKKYPKFLTIRNMISAILKDKWLVPCPICGTLENYNQCIRRGPMPTCGKESCRLESIKRTSIKKYGSSLYMNSKEYIEKKRKMKWKPWNSFCSREENTKFINHYHKIKKKLKENHILGLETIDEYKGVLDPISKKHIKYNFQCELCGSKFISDLHSKGFPFCKICNPKKYRSVIYTKDEKQNTKVVRCSVEEREIGEFCKKICNDVLFNYKGLIENSSKEVDIFLPSLNLAIEYDGLYWHSSKFNNRYTHLEKTKGCQNNNINLIHIFEDEWIFKKRIVKNYLRKIICPIVLKPKDDLLSIISIETNVAKSFLEKYHINGYKHSNLKYGLYYKNRLISVMTFGKPKFKSKNDTNWELTRFETIGHFFVENAFEMLFNHFLSLNHVEGVVYYVDKRWKIEKNYEKNNFKFERTTEPNYFYVSHYHRFSRYSFQKHLLKDKLPIYDESLSEIKNMENNGYYLIWDCGNDVYSYHPIKNRIGVAAP